MFLESRAGFLAEKVLYLYFNFSFPFLLGEKKGGLPFSAIVVALRSGGCYIIPRTGKAGDRNIFVDFIFISFSLLFFHSLWRRCYHQVGVYERTPTHPKSIIIMDVDFFHRGE